MIIIYFFFFLFFFFRQLSAFKLPEKVYDISLWNFIYDIGHPKSVRSEPWLTEPFSVTGVISPDTENLVCATPLEP